MNIYGWRNKVNQVTFGFEQNQGDSPGSPPIYDKLEHPMPIRYLEGLSVQPRSFPRARDHLAGKGDGRPDVRVQHGEIELEVVDLEGHVRGVQGGGRGGRRVV
jgi:hypothetical protein